MNFETYVSLEVAKLLRKAGFDWKVFGYYNKFNFFHEAVAQCDEIKAPTLEVVQKWLREVKGWHISVYPETTFNDGLVYNFSIYKEDYDRNANHVYTGRSFVSFEEAQETGIKKILEIILK